VNYSRSVNEAESVAERIRRAGGKAIVLKADMSAVYVDGGSGDIVGRWKREESGDFATSSAVPLRPSGTRCGSI
jgi:hypothetical protein